MKHVINRIKALHNKALNAKRSCYTPGCGNYAQNCHVLQKNGILNHIENNGFIRQFDTHLKDGFAHHFKRAGINSTDIMAFPGFCNSCDTRIFLPIESKELDFNNYAHLLLFTYRAIICELHKADAWLSCCEEIISDEWYDSSIREDFKIHQTNYRVRRNAFANLQFIIGNNLFNGIRKWAPGFIVFRVPKQDVACSALYGPYVELDEALANRFLHTKPQSYGFPFPHTGSYIHSIPTDKDLVVVFGYHKYVKAIEGIPIEQLPGLSEEAVMLLLGTLLVKRVETWSISESLYQKWHSTGVDKFIMDHTQRYLNKGADNIDMFNLFPSNSRPVGRYVWGHGDS
jgi:hypothetical protein